MVRALVLVLVSTLAGCSSRLVLPQSPCPDYFQYELVPTEPDRWYGVVSLTAQMHWIRLNIILDGKASLLGNWIGDVSTKDNINFKIKNKDTNLQTGTPVTIRFFVQFSRIKKVPWVTEIKLNGQELCKVTTPPGTDDRTEGAVRPETVRPGAVVRPETIYYEHESAKPATVRPTQDLSEYLPLIDFRNPNLEVYFPNKQSTVTTVSPSTYTLSTVTSNPVNSNEIECGKVGLDTIPLIVSGGSTLEGQWPWQVALFRTENLQVKYICGGTLVNRQHVITAGHCVIAKNSHRLVNKNTLAVFLGKHNLQYTVRGVQVQYVDEIVLHPKYNFTSHSNDVAILRLLDPVQFTDVVRPACLWPENKVDITYIVGKNGTVTGWGFDETGQLTEELMQIKMPVVDELTCIKSNKYYSQLTSDTTYCAGSRDGTLVCNGDSGGGMVFRMHGAWHLRGLVSVSVAKQGRCDPSHYALFTDLAKFLPWIKQNIVS